MAKCAFQPSSWLLVATFILFICLLFFFVLSIYYLFAINRKNKLAQGIESHYSHSLKCIGLASKSVNYKVSLTDIYVTVLPHPGSMLTSEALSPLKAM